MIHFDLPKERSSIIKVIGVGGGGSNAVNHMYSQGIEGVNFLICNTDAQALAMSPVPNKVQLGPHLTQGLGAGANPEIGKQATEESMEEIRRILEVNTKMVFVTAGMGGGTGTGGAPIIARMCKEMGILTVGIVTTPFAYEGKRRAEQAHLGIGLLRDHVDTLLVINNDKLRHQYGNLTMRAAFGKADNVLATAAKCITDVINSTGQMNVDFADVCTVMRNGGVAILGNATVEGENRAQKAIEEVLNSPLLNDNDIRGARWILININSAEGEHEFTMDEVEIIQNYLISKAGEGTDVILGMGYDNSLGSKIGITLIATGFQSKDPFGKKEEASVEKKEDDKIVMTLTTPAAVTEPTPPATSSMLFADTDTAPTPVNLEVQAETTVQEDALAPQLVEIEVQPDIFSFTPVTSVVSAQEPEEDQVIMEEAVHFELKMTDEPANNAPEPLAAVAEQTPVHPIEETTVPTLVQPDTVASGGYLRKPATIYAEPVAETTHQPASATVAAPAVTVTPVQSTTVTNAAPVTQPVLHSIPLEEEAEEMKLFIKETIDEDPLPAQPDLKMMAMSQVSLEDATRMMEEEDLKRKAADRLHKLRNLSFNTNAADPNNEFESVPAYVRRNMDLYNKSASVETFYSNYTVKTDDQNKTQISTINTFLHGNKPD